MIIKIPENRRNKRETLSDAVRIAINVKNTMYQVNELFCPRVHEQIDPVQPFVELQYFYDVKDISDLYILMFQKIIREMNKIMLNETMSVLDFFLLFDSVQDKFSIANLNKIFYGLQEKYNAGLTLVRKNSEDWQKNKVLVDPVVREAEDENREILNRAEKFADEYYGKRNELQEAYQAAMNSEIDFWSILELWDREAWELSDRDQIELISGSGELITLV